MKGEIEREMVVLKCEGRDGSFKVWRERERERDGSFKVLRERERGIFDVNIP